MDGRELGWREWSGWEGYTNGKLDLRLEEGSWMQELQLLPPRCDTLG